MKYHYTELKSLGVLNYYRDYVLPETDPDRKPTEKLFRIAWNRGEDQEIFLDGRSYSFPGSSIVPIVHNQHFSFTKNQDIVMWEFNREFYCILDHDKEVSCAGFLFYGHKTPMLIAVDRQVQDRIESLALNFEDEFEQQDNIQGEMLRMLLKRLIILCTRYGKEQHFQSEQLHSDEYDLVRQFNLSLESNFRHLHQVQDYARLLSKSPKTLSNVFSTLNVPSPIQLIQNRLCLEAKRLLIYSDKSIKEIAFELGFSDPGQFSKYFKKAIGKSPSEFRSTPIAAIGNN